MFVLIFNRSKFVPLTVHLINCPLPAADPLLHMFSFKGVLLRGELDVLDKTLKFLQNSHGLLRGSALPE